MNEKQRLIEHIKKRIQKANIEKDKNNSYHNVWAGKIAAYTEVLDQLRN